jgi:hypothetical protein
MFANNLMSAGLPVAVYSFLDHVQFFAFDFCVVPRE